MRGSRAGSSIFGGVSAEAMLLWPGEGSKRGIPPSWIQNSVVVSFHGRVALQESIWGSLSRRGTARATRLGVSAPSSITVVGGQLPQLLGACSQGVGLEPVCSNLEVGWLACSLKGAGRLGMAGTRVSCGLCGGCGLIS